jgi:hypothetical protein
VGHGNVKIEIFALVFICRYIPIDLGGCIMWDEMAGILYSSRDRLLASSDSCAFVVFAMQGEKPDELYLNLVLDFVPKTVYSRS